MDATVKLSVLIVCYNSAADIVKCLSSLYAQSLQNIDCEVLLLNNSQDNACDLVRAQFPQTIIVDNNLNLGFGKGCNTLAHHAKGDLFLLLNPDTELQANALAELVRAAQKFPSAGAWGGSTYFASGEVEPSSTQKSQSLANEILKLLGLNRLIAERTWLAPGYYTTKVLSGAVMMVSRATWQHVNGFDESFFLYAEEVDLCARIRLLTGTDLIITDRARVTHYVGASSDPARRTTYLYRGKMHLARKSSRYGSFLLYFAVFWAYCLSRVMYGYLASILNSHQGARQVSRFKAAAFKPGDWFRGYSS